MDQGFERCEPRKIAIKKLWRHSFPAVGKIRKSRSPAGRPELQSFQPCFSVQGGLVRYTLAPPCTPSHSHLLRTRDSCEKISDLCTKSTHKSSAHKKPIPRDRFSRTQKYARGKPQRFLNFNLTTVIITTLETVPVLGPFSFAFQRGTPHSFPLPFLPRHGERIDSLTNTKSC